MTRRTDGPDGDTTHKPMDYARWQTDFDEFQGKSENAAQKFRIVRMEASAAMVAANGLTIAQKGLIEGRGISVSRGGGRRQGTWSGGEIFVETTGWVQLMMTDTDPSLRSPLFRHVLPTGLADLSRKFVLGEKIGKGSYSSVFTATPNVAPSHGSTRMYSVKRIKRRGYGKNNQVMEEVRKKRLTTGHTPTLFIWFA